MNEPATTSHPCDFCGSHTQYTFDVWDANSKFVLSFEVEDYSLATILGLSTRN